MALSQLFGKFNVGISSTKFKADFQDLGTRWSVETNKELFWCEIEKWDIFGTTMDEWNEEKMIFPLLSDGEWRHSGRKWMGSNKQRPGISCRARQNKEDSPARKSGRLESASKVSLVAAVALSAEWASSLIIRLLFFFFCCRIGSGVKGRKCPINLSSNHFFFLCIPFPGENDSNQKEKETFSPLHLCRTTGVSTKTADRIEWKIKRCEICSRSERTFFVVNWVYGFWWGHCSLGVFFQVPPVGLTGLVAYRKENVIRFSLRLIQLANHVVLIGRLRRDSGGAHQVERPEGHRCCHVVHHRLAGYHGNGHHLRLS